MFFRSLLSFSKKPLLVGFTVFMLVFALTQYLSYLKYSIMDDEEHKEALQELNSVKDRLQAVISSNLSATKTLAFIIKNYGEKDDFDSIAKEIINSNNNIDALQLTRKGVITHTYPNDGNERAKGFDILKNPFTRIEAKKAIAKRSLFFAGPLKLRQGGIAIIGRLPIFIDEEFWGFSVVIVKMGTLLKAVGIDTLNRNHFIYQLSKINPNTGKEEFFLPNSIQNNTKHAVSVKVADGEWNLYVMANDKYTYFNSIVLAALGLGLSIICGLFAWHIARQPLRLNRLVNQRTRQLVRSKHNYKVTLERVSDSFVSLDKNWCYTYMNKKAGEIFNRDPELIIGKNIWTEFPEVIGQPFYTSCHAAMEQQKYIYIEEYYDPYDLWFENHIYPSYDGITIYFKDVTSRKKHEQEILRGKKFSESIINSLPGVFYLYDKNGKFIQWNKNFETISGYTAEEIKHMNPLEFFDDDEKPLLSDKINEVFDKGSADVEAHFFTKYKERIPYYFNGRNTNLDGVEYLMGVGIDITERTEIQNALKLSEEKYRYLFNNNPSFIIIWEIETLNILEVNEVAIREYGYSRDEFLNLSLLQLRPAEDRDKLLSHLNVLAQNDNYDIRNTWRHLKKNGEIIFVDISSHKITYHNREAVLALAKDITEQVMAENQLKETYDDIRRLNSHLQTVREEERISIAREIHDELGQQLTGLKMDAAWLAKKLSAAEKDQQDRLSGMLSLIDDTVKTVRRISSDLRPGILDDLGLVAALEWQSSEFEKRTGIVCNFESDFEELQLEPNLSTGIFRIYQETLTNVARHANASTLSTRINHTDTYFSLTVTDNGSGFDVGEIKNKRTFGITGMRERAIMFGAELSIASTPKRGTSVSLKLPAINMILKPDYEHTDS
ncbi:MAG: PAS domain S-box protein [Sphingobacteriaceae bacterium]|nr:PAS domain S-box protein [Sphingobacteriaceae bacterium]